MNTLQMQKVRLQEEIRVAQQKIVQIESEGGMDVKTLRQLRDSIARNRQLMSMIDDHLDSRHMPTWRKRIAQ